MIRRIFAALLLSLLLICIAFGALPINHFDRYSSTTVGAYTAGGTSITVTSATGLPTGAVNFYAIVKAEGGNTEEVFNVTNVSGTTLTVVGTQAGTSASNHSGGAVIIAPIDTSAVWNQTAAPTVAPSSSTVSLYIATTGSDSNPCTSSSKCLTLAHALSLVPTLLTQPYQINVADGTYTEGINLQGFVASQQGNLTILGNTGTPANVVFSGTVSSCAISDTTATYAANACATGSTYAVFSGMKLTGSAARGVLCMDGCHLTLSNFLSAGANSSYSVEVNNTSYIALLNTVTLSGFNSTAGQGFHISQGGVIEQYSGTVTVTGATGNNTQTAINITETGLYSMHLGSTTLTITGVQTGIYVGAGRFFTINGGTVSITNTSTPTGSTGVFTEMGGSFTETNGTLTLTDFTTCQSADGLSVQTAKSVTATGCGTGTSAVQGSQIVNF